MKLRLSLIGIALILCATFAAAQVNCVIHPYASCWPNGQYDNGAKGYDCSYGDKVWVRE